MSFHFKTCWFRFWTEKFQIVSWTKRFIALLKHHLVNTSSRPNIKNDGDQLKLKLIRAHVPPFNFLTFIGKLIYSCHQRFILRLLFPQSDSVNIYSFEVFMSFFFSGKVSNTFGKVLQKGDIKAIILLGIYSRVYNLIIEICSGCNRQSGGEEV